MTDSVPEDVKKRRLKELIDTFYSLSDKKKQKLIGTEQLVLVETVSNYCMTYMYMVSVNVYTQVFTCNTLCNISQLIHVLYMWYSKYDRSWLPTTIDPKKDIIQNSHFDLNVLLYMFRFFTLNKIIYM